MREGKTYLYYKWLAFYESAFRNSLKTKLNTSQELPPFSLRILQRLRSVLLHFVSKIKTREISISLRLIHVFVICLTWLLVSQII